MNPEDWSYLFADDRLKAAAFEIQAAMHALLLEQSEIADAVREQAFRATLLDLLDIQNRLRYALDPFRKEIEQERQQMTCLETTCIHHA